MKSSDLKVNYFLLETMVRTMDTSLAVYKVTAITDIRIYFINVDDDYTFSHSKDELDHILKLKNNFNYAIAKDEKELLAYKLKNC